MNQKRLYGIDLIKTVAIIFVVSVHFFLNSGYYGTVMSGGTMIVSTWFRHFFFLCVPLFLISTGFLRYKKTVTKKYYMSLITIAVSYLIAAIIVSVFKYRLTDLPFDGILYEILAILSFKSGYFWYMEMFFGLALLIPFVNLSYNNIKEKIHKKILILILLVITGIFSLKLNITTENKTYYLFSDFWVFLYPFTYYIIGAYINEYRPKIKKSIGAVSLFLLLCFETAYTYFRCKDGYFNWGISQDNGGFFVASGAIILFLMLYDIEIKNRCLCKIITDISKKTLDIYMISYLSDLAVYGYFKGIAPDYFSMVKFAPITVFLVFIISYIYASVKSVIFSTIIKIHSLKEKKDVVTTNV